MTEENQRDSAAGPERAKLGAGSKTVLIALLSVLAAIVAPGSVCISKQYELKLQAQQQEHAIIRDFISVLQSSKEPDLKETTLKIYMENLDKNSPVWEIANGELKKTQQAIKKELEKHNVVDEEDQKAESTIQQTEVEKQKVEKDIAPIKESGTASELAQANRGLKSNAAASTKAQEAESAKLQANSRLERNAAVVVKAQEAARLARQRKEEIEQKILALGGSLPQPSPVGTSGTKPRSPEPACGPVDREQVLSKVDGKRKQALQLALDLCGQGQRIPFKLGGKTPTDGFDTSGFIAYILSQTQVLSGPEQFSVRRLRNKFRAP